MKLKARGLTDEGLSLLYRWGNYFSPKQNWNYN